MNIEEIINKYQYNKDLADFIRQVYSEFIIYLGSEYEPIIYEALLNTEIVNCDNIYTCLKARGMLENQEGESLVSEADLKRATGVYNSYPDIIYDFQSNQFKIQDVKRVVAVCNLDLSKDYIKGALIHELGHLVKSFYQEFTIEGNILTTRSGLIETKEELTYVNGRVIRKVISEKGVGLEEGLNSNLEEDISKRIVNPNYEISGYKLINRIARSFTNNAELKSMIINNQMLKNTAEANSFDNFFMEGAYQTLEALTDRLYSLGLKQFSEIFAPEKMELTTKEITNVIINEYNPFVERLSEARNNKNRDI